MNQDPNLPLVTIITVVFNSVNTLEQAIKSVINQSYPNIEYIVIDGGSNDGSVEVIEKFSSRVNYWISEKDEGIYYAMNKALKQASGAIIGILNSDDWYERNAIELAVNYYCSNLDVDIIHGLLRFIGANEKPDSVVGHYSSFLDNGMIEHPTCFIKKSLYDRVGDFNTNYRSAADYEWMLRARRVGAEFLFIPELLTNFRRGGMSDSFYGFTEELSIKKQFGLISPFKCFYWKVYSKYLGPTKKFLYGRT